MTIPENLIVTMTSWKKRINNVKPVLETILSQSLLPNKVIVNLCTDDFPLMEKELPSDLLDYIRSSSGLIEIYWYIENYKAWKKHLHTLEIAKEDDLIVCIDDDHLYTRDFLEKMYVSYCYYDKKFPVTYHTSKLFHNLWSFLGPGTLYRKSDWGEDYKKYLTQDVLHKSYEDIIISMIFATNNIMILPQMFDLPDHDSIVFNEETPFSHIIKENAEHVQEMMASTLEALNYAFDLAYFPKNYKHTYSPHFWQIFIDMVEYNKKRYYDRYPQVKYAVDTFNSKFLSGNIIEVDKKAAGIDKKRLTKEELVGKGNQVIVTISSWNKRIDNVVPVLQSILNNTILPDVIYVNLARSDFKQPDYSDDFFVNPNISKEFKDFYLKSSVPIIINWYDDAGLKSWKKHVKVIDMYLKHNNLDYVVLCIDDDVLYKSTYIETMLKSYNFYGRKYPISIFTTTFCQGGFPICGYGTLYKIRCFKNFDKYMTSAMYHKFPEDNHLLNIMNINKTPVLPVIGFDYLFDDTNYNEGDTNFGNLNFTDEWWNSYHDLMDESDKIINDVCKDREEMKMNWKPVCYNFSISNLLNFLEDEKSRKNEPIFKDVYNSIKVHVENNPGHYEEKTNLYQKLHSVIL